MEQLNSFDNISTVSELTDITDNSDDNSEKLNDIKTKLNADLNKLTIYSLKDKCKELGISGLSKLKKPDLIQILETEFLKIQTYLNLKSKNELKNLCKSYNIKNVSVTKKDNIIYQILLYNANNMIFKINDSLTTIPENNTEPSLQSDIKIEQPLSLIERLEKQKQEIQLKMQEEIKKQEAEIKGLLEEEERKKFEEEKQRIEEEKKEAKKKKQSIPKNVRIIVWNHYIGEDIIKHKCLCCKKVTISNTNYEVGHVLSEKNGGTHEINNLRPICFVCNHSMGAENMIDFVVKFGLYIG